MFCKIWYFYVYKFIFLYIQPGRNKKEAMQNILGLLMPQRERMASPGNWKKYKTIHCCTSLSLEVCDMPTAFFDCLVPCDHCFLLSPSNSFFVWCLDVLPYSLSSGIWELKCSLCLMERELYCQYWFYVTIASKKVVMFSSRSLGKRSVAFRMLVLISPIKFQENCISCKMWLTGSNITSVAL